MDPIIIGGAVGALGLGAAKYFKVWPFAAPPLTPPPIVNGYVAPPVPPGVPPSWSYQGPPVPPAKPAGGTVLPPISYTLVPGQMNVTPKRGSTLKWVLPAGARWNPGDSTDAPTSIGGDLTYGSGTAPAVLVGVDGAGTIGFHWIDSKGQAQDTLFDINVTG